MRHNVLFPLFLLFTFQLAIAQESKLPKTITIHAVEKPLEEVLQQLHQQYSINFYYSSSKINLKQKISLNAVGWTPEAVMKEICNQAGIIFRINGRSDYSGEKGRRGGLQFFRICK